MTSPVRPSQHRALRLRITAPDGSFQEHCISEFPATVGRDGDCDVTLDDARVSRRHLLLDFVGGVLTWCDTSSTNGFRADDRRRRRVRVRSGQVVGVGRTSIEVLDVTPDLVRHVAPRRSRAARAGREQQARRSLAAVIFAALLAAGSGVAIIASGYFAGGERQRQSAMRGGDAAGEDPDTADRVRRLEELAREIEGAERVTAEHFARLRTLRPRAAAGTAGGADVVLSGYDDLRTRLVVRHRRQVELLYERLVEERDERIDGERYGELDQWCANWLAELGGRRDWTEVERAIVRREVGVARGELERLRRELDDDLDYLEGVSAAEFRRRCQAATRAFAGAPEADRVRERLAAFDAARTQARGGVAPAPAGERAADEDEVGWLRRALPRLHAAGRLRGAPLARPGGVCTVEEFTGDLLTLCGAGGELERIPSGALNREELLQIAAHALRGEELLEAARDAHRWGLRGERDALIRRYLAGALPGDPRRDCVDALLAASEGSEGLAATASVAEAARREQLERALAGLALTRSLPDLRQAFHLAAAATVGGEVPMAARAEARARLVDALTALEEALVAAISARVREGVERLGRVRAELDRRRAAALEVIFDVQIYLPENHPDWPRGDIVNGQRRVDEAVETVRELWRDGARAGFSVGGDQREVVERLRALREEFWPALHHQPGALDDTVRALLACDLERIDLRSFAFDRDEARHRAENRRVERSNRELRHGDLDEKDRAHVVILNDYREMLGRRRLAIELRLCRAARRHSAACDRAGRIWHDGPDGSPGSRAREQGYDAPVGENVALGYSTPTDIWWRGWYRASDHHRNALSDGWRCVGYGYSGSVGTQDFGALEMEREEVPAGNR